jgi:tetraprenyl-beta-curcumene synthase
MDKASSIGLMTKLVRQVFPLVDIQLSRWRSYVNIHCSGELRVQALASLDTKKFHCQGGSFFSLYPQVNSREFVVLVIALQTISDYLDNLCDRAGIADEQAFRQLHLAINHALDTHAELEDYYAFYPYHEDGGYLAALVTTCQQELRRLPAYELVKPQLLELAELYSSLQTYKHVSPDVREAKLQSWAQLHLARYPELSVWEFAAASGSTLGMFILCAAAANPGLTPATVEAIFGAFFPWIDGFHILLDYFIDQAEDNAFGDLNFVNYYADSTETLSRLTHFWQQSLYLSRELPYPVFTETVVQGLLAMYLSDPKTSQPSEHGVKMALLGNAGTYTRFTYALCKILRKNRLL